MGNKLYKTVFLALTVGSSALCQSYAAGMDDLVAAGYSRQTAGSSAENQALNQTKTVDLKAAILSVKEKTGRAVKVNKIESQEEPNLWLAERNAIVAYQESPESKQENIVIKKSKINRLDEVGNSYTAGSLDPIDEYDMALDPWILGESIDQISKPEPSRVVNQGPFRTYTYPGIEATVYTGATTTSRRLEDPLLDYSGHYWYEAGTLTNLHVTDKNLHTIRDIGVGSSRGEVVFSYGSPNAMWKNSKSNEIIFVYVWDLKEDPGHTQSLASDDAGVAQADRKYLAFTFKDSKVVAIDLVDGQAWARFSGPKTAMYTYEVNRLSDQDFVLRGRRIGDRFINDGDQTWKTQGEVYGSSFIGYDDYAVSAGPDHLINRIYINHDTPTRRGICIGDTYYLMLFVYGRPQRVYQEFNGHKDMRVYQYRNPNKKQEYLIFVVDANTKFIKNIMLSDRPADQLH